VERRKNEIEANRVKFEKVSENKTKVYEKYLKDLVEE